jgi:hypothetical protein
LQSDGRRAAFYQVVVSESRIASFQLEEEGAFRADGREFSTTIQLLDHLGNVDSQDDSTAVRLRVLSGSATITSADSVLSSGLLRTPLRFEQPGDLLLEVSGTGLETPSVLQITSRSEVRLDLDPSPGYQESRSGLYDVGEELSVDIYADQSVSGFSGVHYRVGFDGSAIAFVNVDPVDAFENAETIVGESIDYVDVSTVILNGAVDQDAFWIGHLVFRPTREVSDTEIRLLEASAGAVDGIAPYLVTSDSFVRLTSRHSLSFSKLAEVFGLREGEPGYDPRYDLDSDGEIAFPDFLGFAKLQSK